MALNSHKNALELSEGKNMLIIVSAISFYYIGKIYYQQGKLDQAIEFLKKDMNILENIDTLLGINLPHYSGLVYDTLIRIYLDKNSIDVAREYMARFQKYNTEKKIPSFIFYLSKARLLKSSNRTRDRADAERELRKIIESSGEKSKFYSLSFSPVYTPALIELCDLYFGEYKTTHNSEILEEIQPLIEMLLKESERVNSYALQAQTLFLQAKLSLLQMNMGDARRYLTKAQRIAEEHNLQLLARSVSKEHDKLLEFLDKLENTRVSEIPITERIDLASLGEIIAQMQGKRTLDPPEIVDEQPILLLIIGQDGVSYFSHPFVEDWDFDDIFGSFMSTFNTFSSEIFEKSIDRIRIDDNFILINHVEQFLVCYVIKGQSYPGLQKLNRFSDAIKWKPDIWEALNKAVQTSELLEFDNPSSLGEVVNEIFNL
jgi:tetratricopeptide (TPR) repeat protein